MFLGCELTQEVSGSKRETLNISQGRQSKATGRDWTHHRHCSSPRCVDKSGQESWAKTGPGSGVLWWDPVSVVNSSECSFAFTSLKAPWTLCGSKSFPKIFTCCYSMFIANFSTRVVTECAMCLRGSLWASCPHTQKLVRPRYETMIAPSWNVHAAESVGSK